MTSIHYKHAQTSKPLGVEMFYVVSLIQVTREADLYYRIKKNLQQILREGLNVLLKRPCMRTAVLKNTTRCHQKAFRTTSLFSW